MEYWQRICKIALPMALSSICMLLGTLVNVRNVGSFNPQNLYYLALYLPINYLVIALFESMRVCGVFLLIKKRSQYFNTLMHVIILLCFLLFILSVVFQLAYGAFQSSFHLTEANANYFHHFAMNMILFSMISGVYYILTAGLYVLNKSHFAIVINLLTTVSNCALTYFSLAVLNRGIFAMIDGMIWSSGFFALILLAVFLYLYREDFSWKLNISEMIEDYQKSLPLAVPVFISYVVTFVGMYLFNQIVAQFGQEALAGFSLAMRIQSIVILPAFALGIAIAILAAENEQLDYIKNKGLQLAFLLYLIIAISLTLLSSRVAELITSDQAIQAQMLSYLKIVVPSYMGFGLMLTFIVYLEQVGKVKQALMLNFIWFVIEVLVGGSISLFIGSPTPLYMTIAIMNAISLIVIFLLCKQRRLIYAG